jgi:hypothetical protein
MSANADATPVALKVGDPFFFVLFLIVGAAIVVVGLKRGDSRWVIVQRSVPIAAVVLMSLPGVVPGSRGVAQVASVFLLVAVLLMIILRRKRR